MILEPSCKHVLYCDGMNAAIGWSDTARTSYRISSGSIITYTKLFNAVLHVLCILWLWYSSIMHIDRSFNC